MKNHLFLISLFLLLFSSCDPTYDIDYNISNQSSSEIKVILINQFLENDTIIIPASNDKLIFNESGKGGRANNRYLNLDSIPFEFISIEQEAKNYKNNPRDKSFWKWNSPKNKEEHGASTLIICSTDME